MGRAAAVRSPRAEHVAERHAQPGHWRYLVLVPPSGSRIHGAAARRRYPDVSRLRDAAADRSEIRRSCAGELLGHGHNTIMQRQTPMNRARTYFAIALSAVALSAALAAQKVQI